MKPSHMSLRTFAAQPEDLQGISRAIAQIVDKSGAAADPEIATYNLQLAVHEVCVNIMEHAYKGRGGIIWLQLIATQQQFMAILEDEGLTFDPTAVPLPDLENAQIRGYGLFLVNELMDEVTYAHDPVRQRNRWELSARWTK